jgi:hypothetical protein
MYKFLIVSICFFIFSSCEEHCQLDGIVVSSSIILTTREMHVNYCLLLRKSLKKDYMSINQMIKLNIGGGGTGYDHGIVLIELIDRIGEQIIINSADNFNEKDKENFKIYLEVGLEYTSNKKYKEKNLEMVFPLIDSFIKN